MAIPDFQTIMLPLLKHITDGNEHSNHELTEALAKHFQLSEEERNQLLPSGRQKLFTNRVAWAKADLKMAGLIHSPKRGISVITERGIEILRNPPDKIDRKFLKKFPEYSQKIGSTRKKDNAISQQTPQEILGNAYQVLRRELSSELLAQIKNSTPAFFEQLVIDVLVAMGYGGSIQDAGRSIGKAGDEGIDGIIKQDRLGLDIIYVQAKKWENPVSRPEIQKFAGALQGKRARKGVFITTSDFSGGAREYCKNIESRIVLVNGEELAGLMIDCGVGVSTGQVYEIKKIDLDYFEEI
jgi:restriction system protein